MISEDCFIHNTANIGNNVTIMKGVYIGENVTIEDGVIVYPYSVIGTNPECKGKEVTENEAKRCVNSSVTIGRDTVVREFVTINGSTSGVPTRIGNNCYIMAKSHIGHDVYMEENVVISTGAIIGGHVKIGSYTYIGLNAVLHQRSSVLSFCMIGACAFFKGNSAKAITWVGVPSRPIGVNLEGLSRINLERGDFKEIVTSAEKFISEYNSKTT